MKLNFNTEKARKLTWLLLFLLLVIEAILTGRYTMAFIMIGYGMVTGLWDIADAIKSAHPVDEEEEDEEPVPTQVNS